MAPSPTPQAVNCPSFLPPPLHHDFSIAGLFEYHSVNSPNHAVFCYSDLDQGQSYNISYSRAAASIQSIARVILSQYKSAAARYQTQQRPSYQPPVIGIFAISDSLSYIYTMTAIIYLGFTAFPISTRNDAAEIARLFKHTGVLQVFVSEDESSQTKARKAVEILAEDGIQLDLLKIPFHDTTSYSEFSNERVDVVNGNDNTIQVILHSSGTTSSPKAIPLTKKGLINLTRIPCYGQVDLAGKRIAAHTNPPFHAMGLASILWPLTCGATFAIYKPQNPPLVPTPANFLDSWIADQCNIVFCVPVFIEAWAQSKGNISVLQKLDSIVFSGASVNKGIGDMLAQEGVVMHPFWGSTEIGPATMFVPKDAPPANEWDYFIFSTHADYEMKPHPTLQGVFEPIQLSTDIWFPHVSNTTVKGAPGFSCGDYLENHPEDLNRWRMFGRKDDQITLSTGENINPIPIEAIIVRDPHIRTAIMIGTNHVVTALLVEPATDFLFPPDNLDQLSNFRSLIWPTIEKANNAAPGFAYIQKEMILTTSPSVPFEYTPKGTPRRGICLKLYATEIDALYMSMQEKMLGLNQQFPDRR